MHMCFIISSVSITDSCARPSFPKSAVKLLLPKVRHVFSLGLVLLFLVSIPGLRCSCLWAVESHPICFCEPQHPCEEVFQPTGEVAAWAALSAFNQASEWRRRDWTPGEGP